MDMLRSIKTLTLLGYGRIVWNSLYRIVVTIYVTISTIYMTRMVMQCGHAEITPMALQTIAPSMLAKHNNLNNIFIISLLLGAHPLNG
jgi:hypothetical protein